MSNNWKRIRKAYENHQSLHIDQYLGIPIVHYQANKSRSRAYKNFQIYLANY